MTNQEILAKVDHTLLAQTATWDEIRALCDDAIHFQTASVCIPPCYVKDAKRICGRRHESLYGYRVPEWKSYNRDENHGGAERSSGWSR